MVNLSMTSQDDLTKLVRIEVLLNAKQYTGNPNAKAVLGKLLGKNKELRSKASEVMGLIDKEINSVSEMNLEEISTELNKLDAQAEKAHKQRKEIKSKKRKESRKELPPLKNAIKGQVRLRYAPDPSKYPHLGQGMNYLVNRMYADKYDGKILLRFDDTNPKIVDPIYYEAIKDGLKWLGATWDEEVRASQYLQEFYEVTKSMILAKDLYVCMCKNEEVKVNRDESNECIHRQQSVEQNLDEFVKMLKNDYSSGEAAVRLRGDMSSQNTVMRDPIMLRIVADKHPLLDKFYPVFPTYDFESAFMEAKFKITHVIRSGEFGTMRMELQSYLIKKFGGEVPEFFSFGRFNIQGAPTKGRVIRELVETKVVEGWDDLRLFTLVGLKRRGIHPHTPRLLIQEAGLTPKSSTVAWQTLESKSKELLEPISKRYFFVPDPIKLTLSNYQGDTLELPIHPDHPEYGNRHFKLSSTFYLSKHDTPDLEIGSEIRLKDLINIKIQAKSPKLIKAEYSGDELVSKMQKIQWVTDASIKGELIVPGLLQPSKGKIDEDSLSTIKGRFEQSVTSVTEDEIVQLERVGFAKLNAKKIPISGHIVHSHI